LEKNADILICDHARKDALPGSLSWTFIDDSVKHGIIQLRDRYVIGGLPNTARPVGGGGVTKGTRTAFTHEDDVFLVSWLHSHGDSHDGNKVYQEMAAKVSGIIEFRVYHIIVTCAMGGRDEARRMLTFFLHRIPGILGSRGGTAL
jgi:hypothetical protein